MLLSVTLPNDTSAKKCLVVFDILIENYCSLLLDMILLEFINSCEVALLISDNYIRQN